MSNIVGFIEEVADVSVETLSLTFIGPEKAESHLCYTHRSLSFILRDIDDYLEQVGGRESIIVVSAILWQGQDRYMKSDVFRTVSDFGLFVRDIGFYCFES